MKQLRQKKTLIVRSFLLFLAIGLQITQARDPKAILKELQDISAMVLNSVDMITWSIEAFPKFLSASRTGDAELAYKTLNSASYIANLALEKYSIQEQSNKPPEILDVILNLKKHILDKSNTQISKFKKSANQCFNEIKSQYENTNFCTFLEYNRAQKLHSMINESCNLYQKLVFQYASTCGDFKYIETLDNSSTIQLITNTKKFLKEATRLWLEDPAYQNNNPFASQSTLISDFTDAMERLLLPLYSMVLERMNLTCQGSNSPPSQQLLESTEKQIDMINSTCLQTKDFLCSKRHSLSERIAEDTLTLYSVYKEYDYSTKKLLEFLKKEELNIADMGYIATTLAPSISKLKETRENSLEKINNRSENLLKKYFEEEGSFESTKNNNSK